MLKKILNQPKLLFNALLGVWIAINLTQAAFSSLIGDEAYYWMFSQHLDWGFYDHPPMIALLIKLGYTIIPNELGVRILTIFIFAIFIKYLWKLIDIEATTRNVFLFFIVSFSIPVFQLYGFIAAPDSPLLLFSVLFLYRYKKFLENKTYTNAIILGVLMACLLYSKYHGILLIGFVALSNIKQFGNIKFLLACVLGFLLFLPHLYWQYINGFPTMEYHLIIRVEGFKTEHPFNYIGGQLLINNPFIFPVMIYLLFKRKFKEKFDRALLVTLAGFYAFFLLSSFRDHIEPHWTAVALIPLFILTFKSLIERKKLFNYSKYTVIVVFFILITLRSSTIVNYLPLDFIKKEFFNNRTFVEEANKIAGDTTVIFTNSYQKTSLYNFYTPGKAYSVNDIFYKKNQYSYWKCDKELFGKSVIHILNSKSKAAKTKELPYGKTLYYSKYDDLQLIHRYFIEYSLDDVVWNKKDKSANIKFKIYNPFENMKLELNCKRDQFKFFAIFNGEKEYNSYIKLDEVPNLLNPGDTLELSGTFNYKSVTNAKYNFTISSRNRLLPFGYHSNFQRIKIED